MAFRWPPGFQRVPDEPWTREPVEELAVKYDTVEHHGWYANLDPTVEEVAAFVESGHLLVDYSGGTGILIDRLLRAKGDAPFGVVNVDSSPKFLRLSLEKLGSEPRVAFRLLRYLKPERRLQHLDEVLDPSLLAHGVHGIVSTNAIHLYHGLEDTLAAWARVLRRGGRAFVQSGNIARDDGAPGGWIIDDTVRAVAREAEAIVREDPRYEPYRATLGDPQRMEAYRTLLDRFFVPVRPLSHYVRALEEAGLRVVRVERRPVRALTKEWLDFLRVYHEGILGWVGGSEKVEGSAPTEGAVADRLALLGDALRRVLGGRESFSAEWTYLTCEKQTDGPDP